jgi:hypothetical protein
MFEWLCGTPMVHGIFEATQKGKMTEHTLFKKFWGAKEKVACSNAVSGPVAITTSPPLGGGPPPLGALLASFHCPFSRVAAD